MWGINGKKGQFQSLFALLLLLVSSNALAGYYSQGYSGYRSGYYGGGYSGGYSGRSSSYPIISLDLDPENSLNSSFRIAAREDRLSILEKLIKDGADVNSRSDEGETALMYAARNCSPKTVKFLLSHGVDVNLTDEKGRTALIFASKETCVETAKLLLEVPSIHINTRDHAGMAALDYANEASIMEVNGPSATIMNLIYVARKKSFKSSVRPIQSIQSSKQKTVLKPIG